MSIDLKFRESTTPMKSHLLKRDWGEAIELLDCLTKHEPEGLGKWLKSGSTIQLRRPCERFRDWSIYQQRLDPMPFENDVQAIEVARLRTTGARISKLKSE